MFNSHKVYTGRNIAELLSISPKTADNHRSRIMAKLGVHSLAGLLKYAVHNNLFDPAYSIDP